MSKTVLSVCLVALVTLAGCSALPGSQQPDIDNGVNIEDNRTDATNVTQSVAIEVGENTSGEALTEIGVTYPRDHFTVHSAQHEQIRIGVDTDGDGETERSFNETHVSGVNNNAYSFDITLDTGYTLESGDVVMVEYPGVDNPAEPGQYTVEIRLNDEQTTQAVVSIE